MKSETNVIKLYGHWITYPQGFPPLYLFPLKKKKKEKLFEIAVKFICFIFQRKQQSPREVMLQDMFVNLKKPTTDLALWLELRSSLETHNRTTVSHHCIFICSSYPILSNGISVYMCLHLIQYNRNVLYSAQCRIKYFINGCAGECNKLRLFSIIHLLCRGVTWGPQSLGNLFSQQSKSELGPEVTLRFWF